jgi:hypothetical protein
MYKLLPKTKKSRFNDVLTVLITGGNDEEKSCLKNELYGISSIK